MNGGTSLDRGRVVAASSMYLRRPVHILGLSCDANGVGLVTVSQKQASRTYLRSFANIAIGPVVHDWREIEGVIAVLPQAFTEPYVVLRCPDKLGGETVRLIEALEAAFPEARRVTSSTVRAWVQRNALLIRMPQIPQTDAWCAPLIRAAAETVLFAARNKGDDRCMP